MEVNFALQYSPVASDFAAGCGKATGMRRVAIVVGSVFLLTLLVVTWWRPRIRLDARRR